MKTLKSKIIALAVCSALTASAFAAVFNSSDDATKATLDISITAIKPHSDSNASGAGSQPPAPKTEQKIEYIVKEKMAQGLCSKWHSIGMGKAGTRTYCPEKYSYVVWNEYQHQVLATYVNGKRTQEQYMSDRCVYRKGKKVTNIYMNKGVQNNNEIVNKAPAGYNRKSSRCQLAWDATP